MESIFLIFLALISLSSGTLPNEAIQTCTIHEGKVWFSADQHLWTYGDCLRRTEPRICLSTIPAEDDAKSLLILDSEGNGIMIHEEGNISKFFSAIKNLFQGVTDVIKETGNIYIVTSGEVDIDPKENVKARYRKNPGYGYYFSLSTDDDLYLSIGKKDWSQEAKEEGIPTILPLSNFEDWSRGDPNSKFGLYVFYSPEKMRGIPDVKAIEQSEKLADLHVKNRMTSDGIFSYRADLDENFPFDDYTIECERVFTAPDGSSVRERDFKMNKREENGIVECSSINALDDKFWKGVLRADLERQGYAVRTASLILRISRKNGVTMYEWKSIVTRHENKGSSFQQDMYVGHVERQGGYLSGNRSHVPTRGQFCKFLKDRNECEAFEGQAEGTVGEPILYQFVVWRKFVNYRLINLSVSTLDEAGNPIIGSGSVSVSVLDSDVQVGNDMFVGVHLKVDLMKASAEPIRFHVTADLAPRVEDHDPPKGDVRRRLLAGEYSRDESATSDVTLKIKEVRPDWLKDLVAGIIGAIFLACLAYLGVLYYTRKNKPGGHSTQDLKEIGGEILVALLYIVPCTFAITLIVSPDWIE